MWELQSVLPGNVKQKVTCNILLVPDARKHKNSAGRKFEEAEIDNPWFHNFLNA